jgi:hypothetical protein
MSIAQQLKTYEAALDTFAQKQGGKCLVAKDKNHLWDMLFNAPAGLRVLVWFQREVPRGEFGTQARTGKVDRHFQVVITRGAGFKIKPGDSLTEGAGGGRPMFDLVEDVRDLVRTLIVPGSQAEDRIPDNVGIELLDVGGTDLRVDAYEINWTAGANIGIASPNPPEEV